MTPPRSVYLSVMGRHELHVMEWGDPASPALVMWHGLARTGRDFDELAGALSERYFILCPDTIGRGMSSWADAPNAQYTPAYYERLAVAMLDHYGIETTAWLGTSMGGLIGMHVAAGANAGRMTALILNDIGPEIPDDALSRILTYAGTLPTFAGVAEAEDWLRTVYTPFGAAGDGFWRRMAESSVRRRDDGQLTLHYDPRIIDALNADPSQLDNWAVYERIAVPTHVLHGVQSDILTDDIVARMTRVGPRPPVTAFPGCGHAPALATPEDAALIAEILGST